MARLLRDWILQFIRHLEVLRGIGLSVKYDDENFAEVDDELKETTIENKGK